MVHGRAIRPPAVGATLVTVDEASIKHIPASASSGWRVFSALSRPDEWVAATRGASSKRPDVWQAFRERELARCAKLRLPATTVAKEGDAAAGCAVRQRRFRQPISAGAIASLARPVVRGCRRAQASDDLSASQSTHQSRFAPQACSHCRREGASSSERLARTERTVRTMAADAAILEGRRPSGACNGLAPTSTVGSRARRSFDFRGGSIPAGALSRGMRSCGFPARRIRPRFLLDLTPRNCNTSKGSRFASCSRTPILVQRPSLRVRRLAVQHAAAAIESALARKDRQCVGGRIVHRRIAAAANADPSRSACGRCGTRDRRSSVGPSDGPRGRRRTWRRAVNVSVGRGFAYVHYKHRKLRGDGNGSCRSRSGNVRSGAAVAHDCGLIINPDGLKNQMKAASQTLSRALYGRRRSIVGAVTSLNWQTYPIRG